MRRKDEEYRRIAGALMRSLRGGRSQGWVNAALKASYNVASRWESGRAAPGWSEFRRYCGLLGVDLGATLGRYVFGRGKDPLSSESVCASLMSNFTLVSLSEATGLPRASLHDLRSGRSEVTLPVFLKLFEASYDLSLLVGPLGGDGPASPLAGQLDLAKRAWELRARVPEGVWVLGLLRLGDDPELLKACLGISAKRRREVFDYLVRHGFARRGPGGKHARLCPEFELDGRSDPKLFHPSYVSALRVIRRLARRPQARPELGFLFLPLDRALVDSLRREMIQSERRIAAAVVGDYDRGVRNTDACIYGLQLFPMADFGGQMRERPIRDGTPVDRALYAALAAELAASGADLKGALGRRPFEAVAPEGDVAELSVRSGYSESLLRRWKAGSAAMPPAAALLLLDLKGELFGFMSSIGPLARLPLARAHFARTRTPALAAGRDPFASLALMAVKGRGAAAAEAGVEPSLLGDACGLEPARARQAFEALAGTGLLRKEGRRYFPSERGPLVPDRASFEENAPGLHGVKKFWFDFNLERFARAAPSGPVSQGFFVRACSRERAAWIREELRAFYWRAAGIVDSHPAGDFNRIAMLSVQVARPWGRE